MCASRKCACLPPLETGQLIVNCVSASDEGVDVVFIVWQPSKKLWLQLNAPAKRKVEERTSLNRQLHKLR